MSGPRLVAVVIPIYQSEISAFERISLVQAARVLGDHTLTLITHDAVETNGITDLLNDNGARVRVEYFDRLFFSSIQGYNRLLLSLTFYDRFKLFEYLLIVQLDVFVFRNQLASWCELGYDFVGAPWLEGNHEADIDSKYRGVGNGGFSLRKIRSALRVLHSFSYIRKPVEVVNDVCFDQNAGIVRRLGRIAKDLSIRNNTFAMINDFQWNEDEFWGSVAKRNFKWYKVPEAEEAAKFSIEVQPRATYERSGRELPFGCHAWWKYDLAFWQPFIEAEGHALPNVNE